MALLQDAHSSGDLVDQLDQVLRASVRAEGIDPQRDAGAVRRMATAVVREHDERSLTGVVAPVGDAAAVVAELVARVSGFGALQPLLDDPEVEESFLTTTCASRRYLMSRPVRPAARVPRTAGRLKPDQEAWARCFDPTPQRAGSHPTKGMCFCGLLAHPQSSRGLGPQCLAAFDLSSTRRDPSLRRL